MAETHGRSARAVQQNGIGAGAEYLHVPAVRGAFDEFRVLRQRPGGRLACPIHAYRSSAAATTADMSRAWAKGIAR